MVPLGQSYGVGRERPHNKIVPDPFTMTATMGSACVEGSAPPDARGEDPWHSRLAALR
jgi:hypothetical protein